MNRPIHQIVPQRSLLTGKPIGCEIVLPPDPKVLHVVNALNWVRGLGAELLLPYEFVVLHLPRNTQVADISTISRLAHDSGIGTKICFACPDTNGRWQQLVELLQEVGHLTLLDHVGLNTQLGDFCRAPLNAIRLDGALIAQMPRDPKIAAIVDATVNLAHGLGLITLASGNWQSQILEQLGEAGLDYVEAHEESEVSPAKGLMHQPADTSLLGVAL